MCVSLPARVVSVDAAGATVESAGRRWRAGTLIVRDIRAGEWVMVAAGTIVQRLTPVEARQIRDALLAVMRPPDASPRQGETDAAV